MKEFSKLNNNKVQVINKCKWIIKQVKICIYQILKVEIWCKQKRDNLGNIIQI